MKSWAFASAWNQTLDTPRDREYEPRERIWASEIGGAYIDRYLKMKGTPPTNPPNARSLRKFQAGNIWEGIVGHVLHKAGILIDAQERLEYQYPGLLPVSGKLDFLAGGKPDYEKALSTVEEFKWLPEFVTKASEEMIRGFMERYPDGLKEIVLEIKSCSSNMFEIYQRRESPSPSHRSQNFHYLKSKGMDEGHVVYISRDDARILEYGVLNPSYVEDEYKKDIEAMTGFFRRGEIPPKEPLILFDDFAGKFSTNWKVSYSGYLEMLYGFKTQKEYEDQFKPLSSRWNRVLARVKEGKDLTKNNQEALKEMESHGFDLEKVKEKQ